MNRRVFLLGSSFTILTVPLQATAQQVAKKPRIGYLAGTSASNDAAQQRAFLEGLSALGWIEGQNIIVDTRYADGSYGRLPTLAAELVGLGVALIVAGNVAVDAARRVTATVPIVMTNQVDPVGSGLIHSLRRPGGTVTGLTWDADPAIAEKYIELLSEIVPGLETAGAIIDPTVPGISPYQEANQRAAGRLGLKLHYAEIRTRADISKAFDRMSGSGARGVVVYGSPFVLAALGDIVATAAKQRLPAVYIFPRAVALGGLMSYGPDVTDLYRRAASYVDKILKGAIPGDLPVEQPSKFFLALNLKTARVLGLTIPPSLLLRADQVIE